MKDKYLVPGQPIAVWSWAFFKRQMPAWPKEGRKPLELVDGDLSLRWLHHSTCLIQFGETTFITDPIWAPFAGPLGLVGPRRAVDLIPIKQLPKVDAVLVSHNHYDHLCKKSLRHFSDKPIITGRGNKRHIKAPNVIELDWWQSVDIGGVKVTYVPAHHYSARSFFDRGRDLWGGFILTQKRTVYFAADTSFGSIFEEVRDRFHPDYAFLPTGACQPRDLLGQYHMGPEDATKAHDILKVKKSIPIHHSTYQLGDESFDDPLKLDPVRFVVD